MKLHICKLLLMQSALALLFCFSSARSQNFEVKIISPHWDGYRREIEAGFIEWHKKKYDQKVSVRWLDLGGASDIGKGLIARAQANEPLEVDIVFGGGVDLFESLKNNNLLTKINLPEELLEQLKPSLNGNSLYDPDHNWFAVSLTSFGIVYNKTLLELKGLPSPENFSDLSRSEYEGLVGAADPRKSGSSRFMFELILQRYGWQQGWHLIYGISSNVKSFSVHASAGPKDVSSGLIAVSLLIDSYALDLVRKLGPERIGYLVPKDVFSFFGDPIGKLKQGNNPILADRFIEYCLSEAGQSILSKKIGSKQGPREYELGRLPVLASVYETKDSVRNERPYDAENVFQYDSKLASHRWAYVTKLLGALAVDMQNDFYRARYKKSFSLNGLPVPIELSVNDAFSEQEIDNHVLKGVNSIREQLPDNRRSWWLFLPVLAGLAWVGKLISDIFRYR